MRKKFTKLLTLFLACGMGLNSFAQTGDNCATGIVLTGDTSIAVATINPTSASSVATDGANAVWYLFTAPSDGAITVNSCVGVVDTEVAIHDLGATGDCGLAVEPGDAENDDFCGTTGYASEISVYSVTSGNTYAIEWGDQWGAVTFAWDLDFIAGIAGCTDSTALNYDPLATINEGCINVIGDGCEFPDSNPIINALGTPDSLCINDTITVGALGLSFSGQTSSCDISGEDYWYSWVATSENLSFTSVAPQADSGNPGIAIYQGGSGANCDSLIEVTCFTTFQLNAILSGWEIGDELLIQIQDFTAVGIDQVYCLTEVIPGCNNPIATNYDATATVNDGTCEVPGSDCATGTLLTGCSGSYVNDTIYSNTTGVVATDFDGSRWYIFEAPGNGVLQLNFTNDFDASLPFFQHPESYVHDLGAGTWTGTAIDSVLCANVDSTGVATNPGGGNTYSTNNDVIAGNVYAIELGNSWTQYQFDWDWQYGCEAVDGVIVSATTENAAQIDFIDTLSDGSSISPNIEYGITGFTPGTGTTISGNSTPIIVGGLASGSTYDYCIDYPCTDGSGCSSIQTCGSFTTEASCTTPLITVTPSCIANGFYSVDVTVTNPSAFVTTIVAPGNPSGFNINIDQGAGFTDTGLDVVTAGTAVTIAGPFTSGTSINIQLEGIDLTGCPSAITTADIDCSCFGLEPVNDDCIDALSLTVDTVATCDGITAPFTLSCASGDATDAGASCFNAGVNGDVWFSFVAPLYGQVQISTDYAGGLANDTEIALYSGGCNTLVEIGCSQDAGVTVAFNSVIITSDLIAGDTYFVQVDLWGGSPAESFCIDVIDIAVPGCTDDTADNYDPAATADDGSCATGCAQTLSITGLVATGLYEADDVITSDGQVNMSSGGPVTYNAGGNAGGAEYIELTNGFDADGTVDFTAENIQCDLTD